MEKECNSEPKGESDDSTICKIPEAQPDTEQNTPGKKVKTNAEGKENLDTSADQPAEKFCFECNRPLALSRHLISIAGQANKSWHPECFKCTVCSGQLDQEASCHLYKDKIICKQDYMKMQREKLTKCSRCQWPISASDWVRRAGSYVYHLACFSCDICMRQLSTGEQFTLSLPKAKSSAVRLLCRLHFAIDQATPKATGNYHQTAAELADQSPPTACPSAGLAALGQSSSFEYNNFGLFQQSRNKSTDNKFSNYHKEQYLRLQQQQPSGSNETGEQAPMIERPQLKAGLPPNDNHFEGDDILNEHHLMVAGVNDLSQELMSQRRLGLGGEPTSSMSTASSTNGSTSGNLVGLGPSKSKRVRTTFTEDQLSILQTHFQIDSNPDGQDLERIATITGLSKRVTQVWFQNSRARQKKYMIKRKPSSGGGKPAASGFPANLNSGPASSEAHSSLSLEGSQHKRVMDSYQLSMNTEELRKQRQKWCSDSEPRRLEGFEENFSTSPSNPAFEEEDNEGQEEEEEEEEEEEDQIILSEDEVSEESRI